MSKFSKQHHNAIAKDIRTELTLAVGFYAPEFGKVITSQQAKAPYYAVDALVKLSLRFAARFVEDNPRFDPLRFLDACSPNPDLYPLAELWDEYSRTS